MKNTKRNIKKHLIDWLWSAINFNETQIIHIGETSAVATDGIRIHAVNAAELPNKINGIDCISESINNSDLKFEFSINPKYLIDALKGFAPSESGIVQIQVVGDIEARSQKVLITNSRSENIAVIMCAKKSEELK